MVTVTNPCNPTGASMSQAQLNKVEELCRFYGSYLILDCTYEHFDHAGANKDDDDNDDEKGNRVVEFRCSQAPHVVHIFSFSKAFAMAGYRVGYLTISNSNSNSNVDDDDGNNSNNLYKQLMKVQDTIPICASHLSQIVALGALSNDNHRDWVKSMVSTLLPGRDAILAALEPLDKIVGGDGAMYVMGKLPSGLDDLVSDMLV